MTSDNRFLKRLSSIKPLKLAVQVSLICGLALGASTTFAGPREQAKRMHDRLAGIPPTEEVLCAMTYWIDPAGGNDPTRAAMIVMDTNSIPDTPTDCNPSGTTIDNSLSKKAFYSVSLKDFVTPWTNEDQTVHEDLNDYSALVIGMIRDNVPFDTVLSADLLYKGNSGPALSNANNDHYIALQNSAADLSNPSVLVQTTQSGESGYLVANPTNASDKAAPAGVTSTRAASLAFFTGGTNRLMWRMTAVNYLCRDMEQLKDVSRTPDRIRQDVSRSPGGDSSIFLSACMGCHAGMDPLASAYAYYDHEVLDDGTPTGHMLWKANSVMFGGATVSDTGVGEALFNQNCASCHSPNDKTDSSATNMATRISDAIASNRGGMGSITLTAQQISDIANFLVGSDTPAPVTVTAKNLINSGNFKYGYVTQDDQWTNYWRVGPNSDLEWGWNQRVPGRAQPETATIASGYGAASLGYEVTSSKAFAQCQVEKVYKFVCLHDPSSTDAGTIEAIRDAMPGDNYNMKDVFAKVAPMCMGD